MTATATESILEILPGYDPFRDASGFEFDADAAQHALDFFPECLKHVKGPEGGKPFVLEPWQQCIVANLFGWKEIGTGLRRYRECFLYVGKKNGKTCFAAGVLLYMLTQDNEMGAEIYSAASSAKQAELVFQHVCGMIRQEPAFQKILKVYGASGASTMKAVMYEDQMSAYKCLASDADTADGANVYCAVIDELHRHKKRDLTDVMEKSTASRNQSLILYTTTADYNRPSLCNEKRSYAMQVRDGIVVDPHYLPCVYEVGVDEDYNDHDIWKKANPNLGVTISKDFIARELQKAIAIPAELNNFLRLHLNIVTDSFEAWIHAGAWDALTSIDESELDGMECHVGIDLSSTRDLTSIVFIFPLPNDEVAVLPRFWIPRDGAHERQNRDRVPYLTWAREGFLTLTEGNAIDQDAVHRDFGEIADRFEIQSIGIDRWNATHFTNLLTNDGHETLEFRQTYTNYNPPSKEFERLIAEKKLRPVANPIMRWCLSNVIATMDSSGNIKPDRKKSTEKIDGIVAALMGLGRLLASEDGGNVYDKRGFLSL